MEEKIDLGKVGMDLLVNAYIVYRLANWPVLDCEAWLLDSTNVIVWCGSYKGYCDFVDSFITHYQAAVCKVCHFCLPK